MIAATSLRAILLTILPALAATGTARAQAAIDAFPAAADDPIQYAVTDASGAIVSHAVIPRKEHKERLGYLVAQFQFIDGGVKGFLISEEGAYQPLVAMDAVRNTVSEMRRMLNDPGLPAETRSRIERRLRDQEDPARHDAAKRVLRDQFLNLNTGAMDWSKVRGTLRGTFRMSCTLGGVVTPIDGTFQIVLMGNGSAAAAFTDARQAFLRADGRIDPFGLAEGSTSGSGASVRWSAKLERSGEQLLMTQQTLQVTPTGQDRCDAGTMALGTDVSAPPTETWYPWSPVAEALDPAIDWRGMRGVIVIDGMNDCFGASGVLPRINSRWTLQFMGDGSVQGTVQTWKGTTPITLVPGTLDVAGAPSSSVSGTIDNYKLTAGSPIEGGIARGTTGVAEGEFTWTVPLVRPRGENTIQLYSGWLPSDRTGQKLELKTAAFDACQGTFTAQLKGYR